MANALQNLDSYENKIKVLDAALLFKQKKEAYEKRKKKGKTSTFDKRFIMAIKFINKLKAKVSQNRQEKKLQIERMSKIKMKRESPGKNKSLEDVDDDNKNDFSSEKRLLPTLLRNDSLGQIYPNSDSR